MSAAQIKVWHKCFKDGGESDESDSHSGRRPATSRAPENAERVRLQSAKVGDSGELEAHLGIPKNYCI